MAELAALSVPSQYRDDVLYELMVKHIGRVNWFKMLWARRHRVRIQDVARGGRAVLVHRHEEFLIAIPRRRCAWCVHERALDEYPL